MTIKDNHPKYVLKIDPKDKTYYGKEFGDVPFTREEFHFDYSKSEDVKKEDIPMAFVKVFLIDEETVMKAWEEREIL